MSIDYSDTVGWPAAAPRVYSDPRRIMPPPTRMATRKNALDRHARYRARKRLASLLVKP
jgi:hypothetical protein